MSGGPTRAWKCNITRYPSMCEGEGRDQSQDMVRLPKDMRVLFMVPCAVVWSALLPSTPILSHYFFF